MEIERSGQHELSAEEQAHLEKLRHLVESALADGKVSETETQAIRALIHADHQVTPEELQTIRSTMKAMLGDATLEYDWS
ncbi:TerB family tellurite resistance protein [Halomicronema sp. CCY15110]|uniref:TerB family tellurite resistance protein n=1 Tax=Halomicronema sp. CCY15110 TaxID=2767773 RepID=UPI00194E106A|nr:TerB family tellurite resistance protein [Halomicronema sp. CCY15110]